jgi:hypothetical protein
VSTLIFLDFFLVATRKSLGTFLTGTVHLFDILIHSILKISKKVFHLGPNPNFNSSVFPARKTRFRCSIPTRKQSSLLAWGHKIKLLKDSFYFIVVTDIFLQKNSATPPRAVALRLAQHKKKSPRVLGDF